MPDGSRRELPMQHRMAPMSSMDEEKRTVDVVWTTGAPVRRMDWWTGERYMEELSLEPGHVRMDRMNNGAPLLAVHNQWELRAVVGTVEPGTARLKGGEGIATVRFDDASDPDAEMAFRKVKNKIVRSLSVGYVVHRYQKIDPPEEGGIATWRAIDWEPVEVSLVPVPADAGAQVRGADGKPPEGVRLFPCEFITPAAAAADSTTQTRKESTMTTTVTQGGTPAADPNAGKETPEQIAARAAQAERARVTEIQERAVKSGVGPEFAAPFVRDGKSVDEFCRAVVDEIAKRSAEASKINGTRATVVEDERVKLRSAVSAALVHRVNPKAELPNGAGEYRYMSMLRLAEEILHREGVHVRGLPGMEIAARAMMSTSDFPNILADAFNKRLRQNYIENQPSYSVWARRAPNAPDFKTINVIQLSNAPDLSKVLEGGEFKRGSLSDGKETYSVATYGRIIPITRQALVNDDMSAFDRLPRLLTAAARRLENRTVYGVLVTNGNLSDGGALFNATAVTTAGGHANLATGTGSVLSASAMITARAGIRVQKGRQSEELNLAPRYAVVPAALEQTIYQLTSNQYTPTKPSDINEFRTGGRTAVQPVVDAYLDGQSGGTTKWWLMADSADIDTVEYCYLDGSEGLYLENQIGFDTDGIELKARLDFAAAAIDFRGMYQSNGV